MYTCHYVRKNVLYIRGPWGIVKKVKLSNNAGNLASAIHSEMADAIAKQKGYKGSVSFDGTCKKTSNAFGDHYAIFDSAGKRITPSASTPQTAAMAWSELPYLIGGGV